MADKEGGGYRHRARGDKGVVVHVSAEDHAALVRAVQLRGARLGGRLTIQEWVYALIREGVAQELAQLAPPAEPKPKRKGKKDG